MTESKVDATSTPTALVLVTGQIGAGKSTTAALVGRRLSRAGHDAADVDVDDVTFMQRKLGMGVDEFWLRGARAHAALVAAWFALGIEFVIAHGPYFEPGTLSALLGAVPEAVPVHHCQLRVTFETARDRVRSDDERGEGAASRDPAFLLGAHDRHADLSSNLPAPRWDIDTEHQTPRETAQVVVNDLLSERAAG